ncbi:MAG TPA: 4Fe-4S dicluster domain-containing protein [Candidatus Latescibacteria bacterium]|nr:4Fe-4S dicluster domain-containing protein [Candidatus Latescibacterota bacterium]
MRKVDLQVDGSRCKGCGLCVEFCPAGVLELSDEGYPRVRIVGLERCTGCFNCVTMCPDVAISVKVYEEDKVG